MQKQEIKLDIESMFGCIEDYKSDFAFELSDALNMEMKKNSKTQKFQIPKYIEDAFRFIEGVDVE